MRIQDIVEKSFDDKINLTYFSKHPHVAKWLLKHPRKKLCIENIVTECRKAELSMAGKLNRSHLEWVGEQYAVTFMKAAIEHEKQEKMHYLEKEKMKKDYQEKKDIMEMFDSEDSSVSLD